MKVYTKCVGNLTYVFPGRGLFYQNQSNHIGQIFCTTYCIKLYTYEALENAGVHNTVYF